MWGGRARGDKASTRRRLADEQAEAVVPRAPRAADFDPDDADGLQLARALDAADVDGVRPAEVGQHVADDALGVGVVTGDQHGRLSLAEARVHKVRIADRV